MASISSNNTWGDVRTCAVPVVTITGTISNPDYNTVTTGTSGTYTISSKDCVCTPQWEVVSSYTYNTEDIYKMIAQDKKIKETLKNPFDKKIKELKTRTLKNINTPFVFTEIKEYVPNKVYEFTISPSGKNYPKTDIKKIKTICDESDTFSLDFAFALAIIKYLHPSKYTPEGYARKAKEALYIKDYLKVIKYGKKLFGLLQEKEAWEEEQEILKKERHKKYVEKKKRRDNRRKQEEDSRLMNVIRKAIKED